MIARVEGALRLALSLSSFLFLIPWPSPQSQNCMTLKPDSAAASLALIPHFKTLAITSLLIRIPLFDIDILFYELTRSTVYVIADLYLSPVAR